MHITLRPNEKLYINGAVLRVDRKVSLELMNDAVFLLEAHVMLERNATTPLRKLYFIVQLMLIEPLELEPKKVMFSLQGVAVAKAYGDVSIQMGLSAVTELVNRGRAFEALKVIRSMLPIEDALLADVTGSAAMRPAPPVATASDMPAPRGPGGRPRAPRAASRPPVADAAAGPGLAMPVA